MLPSDVEITPSTVVVAELTSSASVFDVVPGGEELPSLAGSEEAVEGTAGTLSFADVTVP